MRSRPSFIATALECIELIRCYTEGYDLAEFLADRKTQDAVVRNLEVIGQALKDYGLEALLDQRPDMPWRQILGMRNILAHQYLGVDPVMVWDTVQTQLDPLQRVLAAMVQQARN